jgi:transcriptional regulator with XRE-family HTH domain
MQNRLCEIRTQRGMTQEELALAVHVKGATISRWENNINHIPLAKLPTLARVLQVQAWDIVPQLQTWQPLSQEVTQEVAHG